MKPFIIADVGSNHRGSLDLALKHIEAAKECGADAAKFQFYSERDLYGTGSLAPSFPSDWLPQLKDYSDKVGIEFMCTAFSVTGYEWINPYVKTHKVASCEMKHVPILDFVKSTGKPWIVSTGGAHYSEVSWLIREFQPTTVLECVALYPAEPKHYNVSVLHGWAVKNPDTRTATGISDHTLSNTVALTAVGMGATVFEKHFDVCCSQGGFGETPDGPVSIRPIEMAAYCKAIHDAFASLGDGIKRPAHQHEMALKWRRRLIATRDLNPGDTLKYGENFGIYRSLIDDTRGGPPEKYLEYDGKVLTKAVKQGAGVWRADFE